MIISVSSSAALMGALASATAGTTILLAPGNYGDLSLSGYKFGGVTIQSSDPAHPAAFSSVTLKGVQNLTFDSVKFDKVGDTGPARTVDIYNSTNIAIKDSVFDGANGANGYPTGYALGTTDSTGITVSNSEFFTWHRAAVFSTTTDLTVTNNNIHDIREDAIDIHQVHNTLIEGNYIHDWRKSPSDSGHADIIAEVLDGPSTNLTIKGNFLNPGSGANVQSIFLGGGSNITITDNVIYAAFTHGITVGDDGTPVNGLTITNNTILQNKDAVPSGSSYTTGLYTPSIHWDASATGVVVARNIVPNVYNPQLTSLPQSAGNLLVQNSNPSGANYVGNLFVDAFAGATATLADLKAVPGGVIDRTNVGSSLDQPESSGLGSVGSSTPTPSPTPTTGGDGAPTPTPSPTPTTGGDGAPTPTPSPTPTTGGDGAPTPTPSPTPTTGGDGGNSSGSSGGTSGGSGTGGTSTGGGSQNWQGHDNGNNFSWLNSFKGFNIGGQSSGGQDSNHQNGSDGNQSAKVANLFKAFGTTSAAQISTADGHSADSGGNQSAMAKLFKAFGTTSAAKISTADGHSADSDGNQSAKWAKVFKAFGTTSAAQISTADGQSAGVEQSQKFAISNGTKPHSVSELMDLYIHSHQGPDHD